MVHSPGVIAAYDGRAEEMVRRRDELVPGERESVAGRQNYNDGCGARFRRGVRGRIAQGWLDRMRNYGRRLI